MDSLENRMNYICEHFSSIDSTNEEAKRRYAVDDEDMLDQGEYFRDLVDLPFKFFPVDK